ncbi:MAG: hypothetical protein PHO67_08075 [Candidatus Omnitrophica bacterium]|nr:hypothetical protein [Candidatus Omnitrophota bacterium]
MVSENSFITRLVTSRITRPIAEFIAYYLGALEAQELERRINEGWSLVDMLKQRPREELLLVVDTILEGYPDIKRRIDKSRKAGAPAAKNKGLELLENISVDRLIFLISDKLPAQGAVLARHPGWVQGELKSVGTLLV